VEGENEGWLEEEGNNCIMDEGKEKWIDHDNRYKYNGATWGNNWSDSDNGGRGNDTDLNNNDNNIGVVGFKEEEDGWWENGCRYYYGNGNENKMKTGLRIWAREFIPKKLREEMERLAMEDEIMEIEEAILMEELKGARKARGRPRRPELRI